MKKRRPRPAVSREKKTKGSVKPSNATLLRRYSLRLDQFRQAEITYQCHLFVRKIANAVPPPRKSSALLQKLYSTAKAFQLNELEVAVWSLYLTRIVWEQHPDLQDTLMTFAALATKEHFDSEPEVYRAFLASRIPDFDVAYANWRTSCQASLEVYPTELRDRFQELCDTPYEVVHEETPDYNLLILAILEMSPPLQPSQFEEDLMKHLPSPPVLSLQDDHKSGATAPSCSPSDTESAHEAEEVFWEVNSPLPPIGSLSDIWPELSPDKKQGERAN